MNKCTDNITHLDVDEFFVFGSNLMGHHAGGAAHTAWKNFGAVWGEGEGLTGLTYAFPTLNEDMQRFSQAELESIRDAFYRCVRSHRQYKFLLTKVGCGIAGYDEQQIKQLFTKDEPNLVKPKGW